MKTQSLPLLISTLEDLEADKIEVLVHLSRICQMPIGDFIEEALWEKLERELEAEPELLAQLWSAEP